jgi:hypothetical protein
MFDRADLKAAIEAGAISADNAARLEAFLKARSDPDRGLDSENLRFLTNFNDVFLAIGMAILVVGVSVLSGTIFGEAFGASRMTVVLTPLPVLATAWALAEYFCGRRRLLLPSMVLAVTICASAAVAVTGLLIPDEGGNVFSRDFDDTLASVGYAGFGASALAALAIFYRFRLPFSLFLAALSVAGVFYTGVARLAGESAIFGGVATLIAGLATLATAIWFDARDPQRASISSDCAFWLHMAAAPQIMLGLRGLILGSGFMPDGAGDALAMLAALVAFGVLSLALNRRALIVSGLISFIAALGVLVEGVGGGEANTLMLTALIVGGAIVLLGGGWRTARRFVLKLFPQQGFAGRIFPPEPA